MSASMLLDGGQQPGVGAGLAGAVGGRRRLELGDPRRDPVVVGVHHVEQLAGRRVPGAHQREETGVLAGVVVVQEVHHPEHVLAQCGPAPTSERGTLEHEPGAHQVAPQCGVHDAHHPGVGGFGRERGGHRHIIDATADAGPVVSRLQHHHGRGDAGVVGEREVDVRGAQLRGAGSDGAAQGEQRTPGLLGDAPRRRATPGCRARRAPWPGPPWPRSGRRARRSRATPRSA